MIYLSPSHPRRAGEASAAPRHQPPLPRTAQLRPGEGPDVRLRLGERLDMAELRRIRDALAGAAAPRSVELDLSGARGADGDALLLLEADLSRLADRGSRICLRGISSRLHLQLYLHPIARFADGDEALFSDPDLDWPGFRASRR